MTLVRLLVLLSATLALSASQLVFAQSTAAGDGLRVGVITSSSGGAAAVGASQALAAEAWADATERGGGIYGVPVLVDVRDDGGLPARALAEAQALIAGGAHALVCCTTATATRAVAQLAEREGILLIAPSDPQQTRFEGANNSYWTFSLWPSESDAMAGAVAAASAAGRGSLALFTLDNEFGDQASETLQALLGYAGMRLAAEQRYSPNERELRPEALLLASHQPGGVVVWGMPADTAVAVGALRARGYEGPVYARAALLAPAAATTGLAALSGVTLAVPPAVLAGGTTAAALPSGYACTAAVEMISERLAQQFGGVTRLDAAAGVLDALDIIAAGVEQLLVLQLPPTTAEAVLRQALRDAVVGLSERCGASGLIDLQEGRRSAIVPRGLVPVTIGRFGALEAH